MICMDLGRATGCVRRAIESPSGMGCRSDPGPYRQACNHVQAGPARRRRDAGGVGDIAATRRRPGAVQVEYAPDAQQVAVAGRCPARCATSFQSSPNAGPYRWASGPGGTTSNAGSGRWEPWAAPDSSSNGGSGCRQPWATSGSCGRSPGPGAEADGSHRPNDIAADERSEAEQPVVGP